MFLGVGVSCRVSYSVVDHCRRLTGELIVYLCSGIRPSSVVVRPQFQTSSSKPLGQSKPNFCGASLGRENESLFATSESLDQDDRYGKSPSKSSPESVNQLPRNLVCSKVKFCNMDFSIGKSENRGF